MGTRTEDGAVLTILAIVAVVLLLAVGLGLDTMIFGSSKAQRRHTAEYVALAAIREFSQSTQTTAGGRLVDAKDRAQQIAGVNVFIGSAYHVGGLSTEQLGPLGSSPTFTPDGPTGKITPGLWYAYPPWDPTTGLCSEPNGLSSVGDCPCDASAKWAGPCFRPLDFNNGTESSIEPNAFQAELWLRAGTKIWTLFSRLVGKDYFWLHSKATAAVVPTHHVMLLDLSRDSHNETHLPYERVGYKRPAYGNIGPSEYAYRLVSPSSCSANSYPCNAVAPPSTPVLCSSSTSPIYTTTDCQLRGGYADAIFNFWCLTRPNFRDQRVTDASDAEHLFYQVSTRHARNEYLCAPVSYRENGVLKSENYIVDSFRGWTNEDPDPTKKQYYDGPEPLTTMLEGVYEATQIVEGRLVRGDLIGMIGIDQSASIDIRTFAPSAPGTTTFVDLEDVTNPTIDAGGDWVTRLRKRNNQHMLFPRHNASLDLPEGLFRAREMLRTLPNSLSAERMVTYIGDGLTSCFGDPSDPDGQCGVDDDDYIKRSVDASVNFVEAAYRVDRIKFNLLLVGDIVGPHTVVRRGSSAGTSADCMTEDEALESNFDWVDQSSPTTLYQALTKQPSVDVFFNYPHRLQRAAASTAGLFAAIRPPCNGASCNATTNRTSLRTACTAAAAGAVPSSVAGLTDSSGRLRCDIDCRTRREQIREAMRRIYFRNPYALVE